MKSGEKISRIGHTRLLVSVFLVLYVGTTTLSLLPTSRIRNSLFDPIRPVILYTGLWQNFILFAPDPPKSNIDLRATISKRNGEIERWQFPRMDKLNIFDRIEKERYRSFGSDYVNFNEVLRPDLARFIARLYRDSSNDNSPQIVTLERYWADIPPPNVGINKPSPSHDNHCTIFTYQVKPSDLQ